MTQPDDKQLIAGGQTTYFPGRTHDVTLHQQLYRYADDLQQLLERHTELEHHNDTLRDACARLNENSQILDELFSRSCDIQIVTDMAGRVIRSNPAARVLATESMLSGSELRYWLLPAYRDNFDALLQRALGRIKGEDAWELQFRRDSKTGGPLIASAQAFAVVQKEEALKIHWILRDITLLREIQFETQITSMVFKHTAEGVMITDVEGEILAVNPAFTRITGYAREEVLGRRPNILRSGMHSAEFYAEFWSKLQEEGGWQGEIYNRKKSGEIYPEWLTVNVACDEQGRILSYVAVFTDMSRLVQTEKRLVYLAHHDTLTGLPNRLLFQDRLEQSLVQSRRTLAPFSLIFIDLDRFKQINDSLGHEFGDIVLKEVACRLASSVREMDTVARLGGDEFVIIAPGLAGVADLQRVCDKVIEAVGQVIEVDEHQLFVGASLGCACYPDHGQSETELLKHADAAMYRAKAAGGNRFCVYDMNRSE